MTDRNRNLVASMTLCAAVIAPNLAFAIPISGQGTWETTLQARDLNGDSVADAYYDTVLNITWLRDVTYGGARMTWSDANAWAAGLNVYGITGWRLPSMTDLGTTGCNYAYSGTDCGYNLNTASGEMAHMYYTTLANIPFCSPGGVCPQPGYGTNLNTAEFVSTAESAPDVHSLGFWTNVEYPLNASLAWYFSLNSGGQGFLQKTQSISAWAVHDGDVGASAVPLPAAAWLFASGLLTLLGVRRSLPR